MFLLKIIRVVLKYFLIYRIQNLKQFNEENITEEDISYAKQLFEYFDKCISFNEKSREESKNEVTTNASSYNSIDKKEENGIKHTSENTEKPIKNTQIKKSEQNRKKEYFEYVKDNLTIALKELIDEINNKD